jgi:mono/diheme cytochrome c family protein
VTRQKQGLPMKVLFWTFTVLVAVVSLTGASAQDQAAIESGEALYAEHCAECHGENLRSGGAIPDLRQLRPDQRGYFNQRVTDGSGQMPAWGGILSEQDMDNLWAYIRAHAR